MDLRPASKCSAGRSIHPRGVDYWLWTSDGTSRDPIIYSCQTVRITAIHYEQAWRETYGHYKQKKGGIPDFLPQHTLRPNGEEWWSRLLYIPASVAIRAMDTIIASPDGKPTLALVLKDYQPIGYYVSEH